MAEDFKALIEAQKETTRLLMTAEQRAEMDAAIAESQHKDKIKSDNRIEAGRKAWQTRQANKERSAGGAAAKEDAQEKASADKKNQNLLGKIAGGVSGMFGKMNEKVKSAGKGFMAMLKTTLLAGFMLALLAFLQSDEWKKMKVWIVEKLVPKLKDFWTKTLKPFIDNLLIFFKDPSWENFKNIFDVKNPLGLVMGLAGIAALLAPGLLFKGLKLGVKAFSKSLSLVGKGLRTMIGGPAPQQGPKGWRMASDKSPLTADEKKPAKAGKVAGVGRKAAGIGKGVLRGAVGVAKFLGPIGLAVTGIMGVIDGVTAGMAEAKKESSTKLSIMKAATAGVISGLTFGLVEQKTIENALSGMGDNLVKFTNWIYTPGEGSPGGTTSAKLFGISLGFPNISELLKAGWNKLGKFFEGIPKWIYTEGEGEKSAKLFGISIGFPNIKEMLEVSWLKFTKFFTGIGKWIYTEGEDGESAKLFGMSLGFPDIKTMLKASWDKFGNFFTGIGKWIYSPGEGSPGGTSSAKLFGFELKFPSVDISLPTKEELVAMLPEWMRDIKLPEFPAWMKDFEFPKFEDLTMPDLKLKENFNKFTASIPQWIKDNIFDPGAAGRGGSGAGSPMKIFGMELKFPSLNISFSGMADKIKSLLPEWLTNPVGYIKGLVSDMAKLLPGFGDDKVEDVSKMSKEDVSEELSELKEKMARTEKRILQHNKELGKTGFAKHGPSQRQRYLDKLAKDQAKLGEQEKRLAELEAAPARNMGGPVTKGKMYNSHFSSGELFVPSSSGMILSAQKTEKIMQAGLQRGTPAGAGAAGPAIVNAPVNTVNNSQTNTTVSSTELKHPSAILNKVNLAA